MPSGPESISVPSAANTARPASVTDSVKSDREGYSLVIEPHRGWIGVDWRELVAQHELLFFLIWRDVKVRYKQTVLGIAWAVLQPLLGTFLFTLIFGFMLKIDMDNVRYVPAVFAGLIPWTFFANGITQAGQSLVNQQQLLTKIYLPRLFVPTSSIGAGLVDLTISLAMFAFVLPFEHVVPHWTVIFVPLLLALTVITTLGVGYLLAALTVSYRDLRYIAPFLVQVWLWASPVVWPLSKVPERYQLLVGLNPMAGIIDAMRSAIFGTTFRPLVLLVSLISSSLLFIIGVLYFRRTERRFADIA